MIIRKLYKVETSHVLESAYTERCRSLHGHSAEIEVFLSSDKLDKAGMVIDFSMLKKGTPVGDFIDAFDHSFIMKKGSSHEKYISDNFSRWIVIPEYPTAENLAALMHYYVALIISQHPYYHSYSHVDCVCVRYHETSTGYAQSDKVDCERFKEKPLFMFSHATVQDWMDYKSSRGDRDGKWGNNTLKKIFE